MSGVGGPIVGLSMAGRPFSVAEDAESNRKLGGDENEVQLNGDGITGRLIKTLVPWMADGLAVSIDDDNEDHEFLQSLADRNDFFDITVEYVSGAIWQGRGQIIGEIPYSSKNSTAPITLSGIGKFTQQ